MNFEPDPADAMFRLEVRAFVVRTLQDLFPDRPRGGEPQWGFDRPAIRRWMQALDHKGWAVPHWPVEWGGTSWSPARRAIFNDELVAANCPPMDVIGTGFVGPVLCAFGSEEQKQRFLPPIRNGDDSWCQGFSEASAGSDVMSMRTTAVRHGNHFVVNGQKLWITAAHIANMMFALARVDAPGNRRQQGLSFLLIDMRSPGVSVRPVIMIDGRRRVNEVVLENVRVPVDHLVGEQGKGWVYARFILDRERTLVAQLPLLRRLVASLRAALRTERRCGAPLIDDQAARLRLAQFEVELAALEFLELRLLHAREDDARMQVLASMLKLRGTELRQRVSEALWDTSGDRGLEFTAPGSAAADAPGPAADETHWSTANYLFQRSATIAGGTSEIQRNIIAGVSLGL